MSGNVGLREVNCVMSSSLFIVYMDCVVRRVAEWIAFSGGVLWVAGSNPLQ